MLCEQLVIGSGTEFFALAVEHLHHQRIEDADSLQCCHAAVDAGESDCTKGASLKPVRSIPSWPDRHLLRNGLRRKTAS
jgi:hypothetical protein